MTPKKTTKILQTNHKDLQSGPSLCEGYILSITPKIPPPKKNHASDPPQNIEVTPKILWRKKKKIVAKMGTGLSSSTKFQPNNKITINSPILYYKNCPMKAFVKMICFKSLTNLNHLLVKLKYNLVGSLLC